ncbi:hypothetical protein, partial [Corynebacterium lizhenjunii]|uniref:hypothetical protein n=1 Tax=Corynebacterium lizhenjunii TaxID=2709394 RepID=UPI0019816162
MTTNATTAKMRLFNSMHQTKNYQFYYSDTPHSEQGTTRHTPTNHTHQTGAASTTHFHHNDRHSRQTKIKVHWHTIEFSNNI